MTRFYINVLTAGAAMLSSVAWAGSTNNAANMLDLGHLGADTVFAELGKMKVGENRQHVFVFTNTVNKALTVTKADTSCECLTVLSYPSKIPAGAAGEVVVKVFGEAAGDFAYAAALEFDDKSQRYFISNVDVTATGRIAGAHAPLAQALPPASVIRRAVLPRDRSLYKQLAEARVSVDLKRVRVVDVRPAEMFAGLHIAGAMNMTAADVSSKPFMRQGEVLMVDEGLGSAATESACRKLRAAGNPNCWILLGGMNAWMRAGASAQGAGTGLRAVQTISPSDYLAVRGFDDWAVSLTNVTREAVSRLLPEATSAAGASATGDWRRVLIVDPDGKGMMKPLPVVQGAAVFWLDGGLAALEQEYRNIAAMKHSQKRTTDLRITGKRWEKMRSGCGCRS